MGQVASREMGRPEAPSFFKQSLEDQIQFAIDTNDHKLLQILLGSKYCQLWQYWFAHAVISYNLPIKQYIAD